MKGGVVPPRITHVATSEVVERLSSASGVVNINRLQARPEALVGSNDRALSTTRPLGSGIGIAPGRGVETDRRRSSNNRRRTLAKHCLTGRKVIGHQRRNLTRSVDVGLVFSGVHRCRVDWGVATRATTVLFADDAAAPKLLSLFCFSAVGKGRRRIRYNYTQMSA